jgi:biogenesis of lysosome-related organelles complex 1 subunit 2
VGDLDLLVRVNKHAAERYKAMADAAEGLETDSDHLRAKCMCILGLSIY